MKDYMKALESQVMIPSYFYKRENGIRIPTVNILHKTPYRNSKLLKTQFASFVGTIFDCDEILALNYYGLMKVSTGFLNRIENLKEENILVRSIVTPVVYFASVKMKDISKFSPNLLSDFADFKDMLIKMRWNKTAEKPVTMRK